MNQPACVLVIAAIAAAAAVTAPAPAGAATPPPQHHGTGYKANPALGSHAGQHRRTAKPYTSQKLAGDATRRVTGAGPRGTRSTQPYVTAVNRHVFDAGVLAGAGATPVPKNNKFTVIADPSAPHAASQYTQYHFQDDKDKCQQWTMAKFHKDSSGQLQFTPSTCISRRSSLGSPGDLDPFPRK